jgi:hypothetical protein
VAEKERKAGEEMKMRKIKMKNYIGTGNSGIRQIDKMT